MIFSIGELLAEFVSHRTDCGLEITTEFSGPFPSGAPAIFADQIARVGGRSAIIGTVGNDPFGRMIDGRLKADGVDTSHLRTSETLTTGTAFVSYFSDRSRVFVFHLEGTAADDLFAPAELPDGSILHISGASLHSSKIRAAIQELVGNNRERCRISFDPNVRPELMADEKVRSTVDMLVEVCDFFLPSDADLEALFPLRAPCQIIEEQLSAGKCAVVVKQGEKGVVGSNGKGLLRLGALPVNEVDPTGAGDCFCGTFLGLLDQGRDFAEALESANVAGALHVTRLGPMDWNPTLSEIQVRLECQEI